MEGTCPCTDAQQANLRKGWKAGEIQVDYFQKTDMAVMQFDIMKNYTPTESQLLAEVGDADVVVFVGGISPSLEGEEMKVSEPGFKGGDRTDIELPQAQRKVMEMLHRAGKRVVFVNCSGSAIAMVPETEMRSLSFRLGIRANGVAKPWQRFFSAR